MLHHILIRDINLAYRQGGGAWASFAFFAVCYTAFAFAVGAANVATYSPAILAVILLFSATLSLAWIFERDHTDGTLEQYLLLPIARESLALAKLAAFWVSFLLPCVVFAVLILLAMGAGEADIAAYALRLLALSWIVAALCTIGSALTLLGGRNPLSRALIIMPLYLPPLILATLPAGDDKTLLLLTAGALVMLPLSVWISGSLLAQAGE